MRERGAGPPLPFRRCPEHGPGKHFLHLLPRPLGSGAFVRVGIRPHKPREESPQQGHQETGLRKASSCGLTQLWESGLGCPWTWKCNPVPAEGSWDGEWGAMEEERLRGQVRPYTGNSVPV